MGKYIGMRADATALLEHQMAHLTIDSVYQSGVLDLSGNHFKVIEHSPNNKSVDVYDGIGYFKKTSMTYRGLIDTDSQTASKENVAITSNSSGNPRIDAIVVYVDVNITSNADASNVLKLKAVAGTPAASPTAPSDGDIQSDIGAGCPFIRLANVAVANGFTSIVNANITDMRTEAYKQWSAPHYQEKLIKPTVQGSKQDTDAQSLGTGTLTLDCEKKNVFEVTLTGNITLALSNVSVGQIINIDLIQDGTGSRMVTWFSGIKWPDNVAPTLTTTASKRDSFVIKCVGSGAYIGYIAGQNL